MELINPSYLFSDQKRLHVLQKLECMNCRFSDLAYVDMSTVHDDKLEDYPCPSCEEYTLEVVTFKDIR